MNIPVDLPTISRQRFETRLRLLTISRVLDLSPGLRRVTLTGPDLAGFTSAAYDDHVKVFFPLAPGGEPVLPAGPAGTAAGGALSPVARDYTPRRFDARALELDLEFVLHGDGPAAQWAAQARAGQRLGIGGPRGSMVVTGHFDWYLFAGDEVALPAIARRLAELPGNVRAIVIAEVADRAQEIPLPGSASLQVQWLHRNGGECGAPGLLLSALRALTRPPGTGYSWIACESGVARAARNLLVQELGYDKQWVKAAGYWQRGAIATHTRIED